jgi:parallel beta-helix repeat protein
MVNKKFSGIMLVLVLASLMAFSIQQAKAFGFNGYIYIKEDGSIVYTTLSGLVSSPPEELITTSDNVTYTLTTDVECGGIFVERGNITIDGQNYTLKPCPNLVNPNGINIAGVNNITIKNINIEEFNMGISLRNALNITITGNNLTNNWYGIYFLNDVPCYSNCSIAKNNVINNTIGIDFAAFVYGSIITGNNITKNTYVGMHLAYSHDNIIYYNWFIGNGENETKQVSIDGTEKNSWDNGTIGNCWSDYTGSDENGDGIGDSPYVIDALNKDSFPIMWTGQQPSEEGQPSGQPSMELIAAVVIVVVIVVVGAAVFIIRKRKKA